MRYINGLGALVAAYILVVVGIFSILMPAYHVWLLYVDPQHIATFADLFKESIVQSVDGKSDSDEPYRLMAWPVIVVLLMIQAKIGVWAIDSSAHLLEIGRKNLQRDDD